MEKIEIAGRFYASIQHVQSAALFARHAYAIETSGKTKLSDKLLAEQKAYVTGAIFSSIAFLEATINEFFDDVIDGPEEHLKALNSEEKTILGETWKKDLFQMARLPMINKFQIALMLMKRGLLNPGAYPVQDVQLLVDIRNDLIHWKPKTESISPVDSTKEREDRCRGRFNFNSLLPNNAFFPGRCLGHGCAEWAVKASIAMVDLFWSKFGMKPRYDHVRNRLMTI